MNLNKLHKLKLLHKQRGIFDAFFDEGGSETKSEQTRNVDSSTTKKAKRTTTADTQAESTSTTQLLSEDAQAALEGLMLDLAGKQSAGDTGADRIRQIGEFLFSRAQGAEDDLNSSVDAIVGEARRSGTKEIERLQTDLAQQAGGSTGNSFVMGATAEGMAQLESQLAALESELEFSARSQATQEFVNSINALSTGEQSEAASSNAVAQIAQVLRGATQTTQQESSQQTQEQMIFNETIKQIIEEITKGTTTTEEEGGFFDIVTGVIGATNFG